MKSSFSLAGLWSRPSAQKLDHWVSRRHHVQSQPVASRTQGSLPAVEADHQRGFGEFQGRPQSAVGCSKRESWPLSDHTLNCSLKLVSCVNDGEIEVASTISL